jgi:mono/diheme cytochrome c family protein
VPVVSITCSADTAYFTTEILPMIISNCATTRCHDATTRKEGVQLTDYSTIIRYVRPFNAATSKLYTVCARSGGERMPPPPMAALTQSQLSRMIVWINQGALNNQCNSGCDSTVFTYSAAVAPIMNTYCKGCHNPASLGGGIDLSTHPTVKNAAAGRLMGSINHTAGYIAMPQGGNKLSDCQIRQIQKWINAGSLNN